MHVVAAQADFVVDALSNLGQEIVIGGILSIAIILLFLRDWRASLAIGIMVPLSVLLALVVLQALDVTVNVLSLGGLALGVGLLVDNAIVVAEASGRRLGEIASLKAATANGAQGAEALTFSERLDAIIEATREVSGPLTAGTLTTLLVFGPIIFVKGLAAALFRDLSLSVVTSVGASLILALTLMPVMIVGRRRLSSKAAAKAATDVALPQRPPDALQRFGTYLADLYERGMHWSLANPGKVFAATAVGIAGTAWVTSRLPKEILPQVDERMVVAAMQLPEGTAIEETIRQAARVEEAARTLGAKGIYSRVGIATDEEVLSGAEVGSSATAQILVPVPADRDASRFADALRAAVPDLAQGALALDLAGQSEFGSLIGRDGRLVRAEVSAATLAESQRWADSARTLLRSLETLADVRDAYGSTQPIVEVALER